MFEQILNLITRGVVALETIAKHYETQGAAVGKQEDRKPSKAKKEVVEDDDDEDEPEEKPAKGKGKGKVKKDADPLKEMRDEIAQYAAIIAGGDDDDANDEFDDLLESYEIKSVAKLDDEDVEDFHHDLKEIVETYFELED